MVRAMLEGRKTQTRRMLKPQPDFRGGVGDYHDAEEWGWEDEDGYHVSVLDICPNGFRVGDRLWVRENCATWEDHDAIYRADDEAEYGMAVADGKFGAKWRGRPSIHMPRWASRLTLTVTEVRVQRLQDISAADAVAEGVAANNVADRLAGHPLWIAPGAGAGGSHAIAGYAALWNSLHGPDAWDANPWVVALTFTVQRGNIDQMPVVK